MTQLNFVHNTHNTVSYPDDLPDETQDEVVCPSHQILSPDILYATTDSSSAVKSQVLVLHYCELIQLPSVDSSLVNCTRDSSVD